MKQENNDARIQEIRRRLQNAQKEYDAKIRYASRQRARARWKALGWLILTGLAVAILASILVADTATIETYLSQIKFFNHGQ